METLFNRYRNLTVLLVVLVAQLLYLAYQVKTNRDERLIRVWAVTAVTPMAGIVEAIRRNTIGFLEDYFILLDVREQNRHLRSDNDKLRMENVYFRNQLATAQNAKALTLFQSQIPSRTVAARVIGNSTVSTAKAVFIDRGSTSGIENAMAVVTPDGIVGKVSAVYPLVAQVLLVTDPTFKVGVESQKGHVHGVLDCGSGKCSIEQVQNEDKIGIGEWFFTSGEDRIFPKGFPVGTVLSVQPGQGMKDIKFNLSGDPAGVEEVLVVLQGAHRDIPTTPVVTQTADQMLPSPIPESTETQQSVKPQTEADKILQKYSDIGKQQNHVFGGYGSSLPDFNPKTGLQAPVANAKTGLQAPVANAKTGLQAPVANAKTGLQAPVANAKTGLQAPVANAGSNKPALPSSNAAAPKPTSPPVPSLLGSRPGAAPPTVLPNLQAVPKPPPALRRAPDNEPPLPLGAPRHKPSVDPSTPDGRIKQ